MTPRPTVGAWSTYTFLGLVGYAVGAIAVGLLGADTDVASRAIAIALPPFGFWFAVSLARRVLGFEQIVFYQAAFAAWLVAILVALCAGRDVWVVSDLVIVLVAIFNTFGRIGCHHVACCHGRPARFGVRYGHAHVRLGFPQRWADRPLLPVQLVESTACAVLAVTCAVLVSDTAGLATAVFVDAYALVRFALELVRGDSGRPYYRGLSEAQWIALASTVVVVVLAPRIVTLVPVLVLVVASGFVGALGARRAFRLPRHLDELERASLTKHADVVVTSQSFEVSTHPLSETQLDVVWRHDRLSLADATRLAADLFATHEIVPGQHAGLYHVLVDSPAPPRSN